MSFVVEGWQLLANLLDLHSLFLKFNRINIALTASSKQVRRDLPPINKLDLLSGEHASDDSLAFDDDPRFNLGVIVCLLSKIH